MEPLKIICRLSCPGKDSKAYVGIELGQEEGCRITSCSLLGDNPVNCSQDCLEGRISSEFKLPPRE
ncbi:MAG: hypothetical protein KC800_06645 [Candidatus Eremiobacteraeota bacterium]|nr:hypothetical protein [Candidatus Eremiobacteraeota bacterium]